jgi:hypothetical protein
MRRTTTLLPLQTQTAAHEAIGSTNWFLLWLYMMLSGDARFPTVLEVFMNMNVVTHHWIWVRMPVEYAQMEQLHTYPLRI